MDKGNGNNNMNDKVDFTGNDIVNTLILKWNIGNKRTMFNTLTAVAALDKISYFWRNFISSKNLSLSYLLRGNKI